MAAVLNRVATAQLRERAYREGFALALGDKGSHRWTSYLHEYHLGNQAGLHSRCSADPASGQPRPCLVRLDVGPTPAGDELGRALPAGPASVQRGRPGLNGAIATSWVTVIAWASRRLR